MDSHADRPPSDAIEDLLDDSGFGPADDSALRAALTDIRALATEVPEPSAWIRQIIHGELIRGGTGADAQAVVPTAARRRLVIAATAGALVLGGASAAAATNRLPDSWQEVAANAFGAPHPKPAQPTNAPADAPGQLKDSIEGDWPNPPAGDRDATPGQIQKDTKPDPGDPGPARPADPGSFGHDRAAQVQADHLKGGNKKAHKHH